MDALVLVALAGFVASLVDGTLGMGFGPTSSTILLVAGLTPTAVSSTVNLAKVATGIAGGVAHWRFGNVDRRLVVRLAVPGCVGALAGVTVLANVDGERLRPWLATLLLVIGVRVLVRFTRATAGPPTPAASDPSATAGPEDPRGGTPVGGRGIGLAALIGGVTNGLVGAWGPVVTPVLLQRRDVTPRVAIGSVNTAEVAVALIASGSLIASLGAGGVDVGALGALLAGGIVAAPAAAWAVRRLAPRALGLGTGTLLVVTNVGAVADAADLGPVRWLAYAGLAVGLTLAGRTGRRACRDGRSRPAGRADSPPPATGGTSGRRSRSPAPAPGRPSPG